MKGRRRAEAIVHTLGYTQLNLLLKAYRKQTNQYQPHTAPRHPDEQSTPPPSLNDLMEDLLRRKHLITDVSNAYIQGLSERLVEIATALE